MWTYRARCVKIVDGDTIDVVLDLGFGHYIGMEAPEHKGLRLRLAGVNTPEVRGEERPEGLAAKEFVEAWVDNAYEFGSDWPLVIRTAKTGKYGRWIAHVMDEHGRSLNADLEANGYNKTPGYGPDNWG